MKPSGFDIIELLETIILPEAHTGISNAASNVQDNAYGKYRVPDEKISELVDAFINALLVAAVDRGK